MHRLENGAKPTLREKLEFIRTTPEIFVRWCLGAMAVAALGWAALYAHLREERKFVVQHALSAVSTLARTHADRLMRSIEGIDQVTRHIRADWRLSGGARLLEDMKREGAFTPSPYYVTLVDADGIAYSSTLSNFTRAYLGDRSYFLRQKSSTADGLEIHAPLLSRISGMNVVDFSRRLSFADNKFLGIVLVSVDVNFLTANYDESILGKTGLLGVISEDRSFGVLRIGETISSSRKDTFLSRSAFPSESGSALLDGTTWFLDNRDRFIGWHPVQNYPLTAIVGLDEADTLAPYESTRHLLILYGWYLTGALIVATGIAILLNCELAWRNHRIKIAAATYRIATEEGGEGFYIAEPVFDGSGKAVDFRVIDCNQQGASFFNLRQEQLKGRRVSSFHVPREIAFFMNALIDAFENGVYEKELDVDKEHPLAVKSVHLKIMRSGPNLAVRLRDISQAKAHVAELRRRGNEDVLTSLPNRQWIQEYLPSAIDIAKNIDKSLAILFIDLDGFKKVNDTAGHAAGDELLKHAAERLIEAVRPHDKVVRFGGDEFVVILENIEHQEDPANVAERVQHAFDQPFRLLQDGGHIVGTSIGIALFPRDGDSAASLLEKADIAMYSVKTRGKHGYQFYEPKFYSVLRARLEKEAELRDAISRDEFVVHYQPRFEVATGRTSSFEALLRWQHPAKGLLEPTEFIGVAEETGLIVEIGKVVVEKVIKQLADWQRNAGELLPVSINVSPRQFKDSNVGEIILSALARHRVRGNLVELEVTESSIMEETSEVSRALLALQEQGIKILVDDFGTGYSSLSQLHRLDFDILKVDQSFTQNLENSEEGKIFFAAIVTMAHALEMRVVAEGVENAGQLETLKSLNCDEVQGFYLSKPLHPGDRQPALPARSF
jgi:diguanylate cyclase (GGDEF)-like protein